MVCWFAWFNCLIVAYEVFPDLCLLFIEEFNSKCFISSKLKQSTIPIFQVQCLLKLQCSWFLHGLENCFQSGKSQGILNKFYTKYWKNSGTFVSPKMWEPWCCCYSVCIKERNTVHVSYSNNMTLWNVSCSYSSKGLIFERYLGHK